MEMRTSQRSGDTVSLLGFGAMRLPQNGERPRDVDAATALRMVDMAMEGGINYFDTAYVYHDGASETILGDALSRYPRDSFKLATKVIPRVVEREEDIERIFDEQLKRCRVDFFDYYLVHCVFHSRLEAIKKFRFIERLHEKKQRGLIRNLGFSYHDGASVLGEVLDLYDWDFAQIQLNYLDWELQDSRQLYTELNGRNIPVIVMEPVRGGALATLSESAVAILKEADPQASPASWAIRFAASLPGVLTVLSGMSTPEQVADNLKTMNGFVPLSDADRETLHRALAAYRESGAIPCTACGYCMDCPAGVDIPRNFAVYNAYTVSGSALHFGLEMGVLGAEKQASRCVGCGHCVPLCPQRLDIPALMDKVAGAAGLKG